MRKLFLTLSLLPFAAFAQVSGARFDNKQPIEITSDSLEVHQAENTATFVGNVVAIQGEVRLKSDRMIVYYTSASDKKKPEAPAPAKSKEATQQQSIKKIDVEGNVFLSTAEETASGARGNYDVINQEIHLHDNVVLTRGQNVLKGDELTYNFGTGRSIINGGEVAEQGASKGKTRVRALFVPEKTDKGTSK